MRVTRERSGYSQERFAQHSGLDRSYVGAIERGEFNVSLNTMVRIAVALNTKASALLRLARL
ncbi:MAG: helix-turn-helix transcriptional regulator [Solirubrobacterales bacterium]